MENFVYEEHLALEERHWWFRGRRDFIEKIIQLFVAPMSQPLTLCEIGSGTGGNLPMLVGYGSVDCVEMNDTARGFIQSKNIRGVEHVLPGHLPDAISLPRQYDAVFSLDVIEHVAQDLDGLKEITKHLNDDGRLIVTVPAYQWLWSAHDVANHHHRRYTKTSICNLIKQAGYEIEYSSYFNSVLFPLAAISRLLERLVPRTTRRASDSTIKLPSPIVNRLFTSLFSSESKLAGKLSIPFGLSIIVVAKKHE